MRDIRPFIDNNEINNLLTFDILFEYYHKYKKSLKEIESIINKMRSKKRKLPDIKFKKYVEDNYS